MKRVRGPDRQPRAVVAFKHGLYRSAKSGHPVKDWQIRRMIKKLRSLCPWIELSDAPILRRWCELEVLCSRAYAALRESGPTNADGEGRRLLNDYRMLVLAQNIIGRELGLSPAARMALKASGTNAALDLVAEFARTDEGEKIDGKKEEPN